MEEGTYDRAEVGVFAVMKGKAWMGREVGRAEEKRKERERVGREIEVCRGWEEV